MIRYLKTGVALLLLATGSAWADKPLWEAGAGVAVVDFATYRGSDQYKSADSPLVRSKINVSGGVAVSWIFGKSEVMVKNDD